MGETGMEYGNRALSRGIDSRGDIAQKEHYLRIVESEEVCFSAKSKIKQCHITSVLGLAYAAIYCNSGYHKDIVEMED
jgi:hypothetical protein